MKKIVFVLTFAVVALLVSSCASVLPARFESFVDKVEKNASSYSEDDWQAVSDQFEKLVQQYDKSYDKLKPSERERIDKAIGRYRAILVKSGINNLLDSFDDVVSGLSSKVRGFIDGIGSFLEELGIGGSE